MKMKKEKSKYFVYLESIVYSLQMAFWTLLGIAVFVWTIGFLIGEGDAPVGFAFSILWKVLVIAIPIIIIIWMVYAWKHSAYMIFTENYISYYQSFLDKTAKNLPYNVITEVIVSGGLWKRSQAYVRERKVFFFHKGDIYGKYDLNPSFILELIRRIGMERVRFIGDKRNKQTINKHFNIDFGSLSKKQQLCLLKDYCKTMRGNERSGEKILKKAKLL